MTTDIAQALREAADDIEIAAWRYRALSTSHKANSRRRRIRNHAVGIRVGAQLGVAKGLRIRADAIEATS